MASEFELKLAITPRQLTHLKHAPWLARHVCGPGKGGRLVSVYFDTEDLALWKQRATLRVRKDNEAYIQTFKEENRGSNTGLGRLEWEHSVRGATPDISCARKKKFGGLNLTKLKGSLKPVFVTTVYRYTLPLRYRGSKLELSLDRGEIKSGRRRLPIHEVEVELKRGKRASVIELGREIALRLDAAYGVASKAERGYSLREDQAEAPVYGQPIVLSEALTAAEAFQSIAMYCMHHFASNHRAIIAGKAEGVHQMRVGLRRLRAAISVFKRMLHGPETEAIKDSLKWLTEELGPARDMDVLVKEAITPLAEVTASPKAVAALKANVIGKRDKGFERARRAVTGERYRRLVVDTMLWINGGRWSKSHTPLVVAHRNMRAVSFAEQELGRRARRVLKKLSKIDDLNLRERHKLRIAVKKLRYASGYFESLFKSKGKAIKQFINALENLQASLGQLNDIRVHGQLAKGYAAPAQRTRNSARLAFAMGELTGEEHAKSRKLLKIIKHRGKRLEHCSPFWK